MSTYVFADYNNFYIACEKLFNPSLEGFPVIVLSNVDNRVIALSQEARQLGIKKGDPYSIIKAFCIRMNVIIYSSNEKLYQDVSHRIMNLLSSTAEEIEVTAINEVFLKYSDVSTSETIFSTCREIREKIKKWVGIPLSLGIGPTKTLAKVANDMAKKNPSGVFDLTSAFTQKRVLENYLIDNLCGMHSALKERLNMMDIRTGWEFRQSDPTIIRRTTGLIGEQVLWELRGVKNLPKQDAIPNESISYTRSFEQELSDPHELAETLSTFVSGACTRLKTQKNYVKGLFVFLESILDGNQGSRSLFNITSLFSQPTNDPAQMISTARECFKKLFSPLERYKKCGVILLDLIPQEQVKQDLCLNSANLKKKKLMESVDEFNAFYKKNTLFYGTMETNRFWKMDQKIKSHTKWKGLAFALAK